MRVGILLGRFAVRRPAGVTDADHAIQFFFLKRFLKIYQLTDTSPHIDFLPLLDRVVKNESYLNMARDRAGAIAETIRNGKGKAE